MSPQEVKKHRRTVWEKSETMNQMVQCSNCNTQASIIKMTPSGLYCKKCYCSLPCCKDDLEPVVWFYVDKQNNRRYENICRNCWQKEQDQSFNPELFRDTMMKILEETI